MFQSTGEKTDLLGEYEQIAVEQITGFKRCHLSAPIYIDYASHGFVNLIGYTMAELHELFNDESVRFVHPDDAEEYQSLLNRFAQNEMTATFSYRVICKNGTVKTLTDTMKSIMINGEMWGFSSVSDSSSAHFTGAIITKNFLPENTVLSLTFDMDTRRRLLSSMDVVPYVLASDISLEDVVGDLRLRVNYRYVDQFDEFVSTWHLRERLSLECLMLSPRKEEQGMYRWMRISTVCVPDALGKRMFTILIADIDDEKCSEIKNVEGLGLDWLTGLPNLSKFHERCLEMGLSDDLRLDDSLESQNSFSSLYSSEFDVMVSATAAAKKRDQRLQGESKCAMAAIGLTLKTDRLTAADLQKCWKQIKHAASALRIITRDDVAITRADAGLFIIFTNDMEDESILIERARLFKAAMSFSLGSGDSSLVNIGIAVCHEGEQFDRVLSCAFEALSKATAGVEQKIVLSEVDGQDRIFAANQFDMTRPEPIVESEDELDEDLAEDFELEDVSGQASGAAAEVASVVAADGSLPCVRIRTFGYFEVFVDDCAVMFSNAKAKELLALLVDHGGGYLMPSFAISRLWESESDNKSTRARYRKTALRLRQTLGEYGILHILDEKNGKRRLATECVDCDLYKYRAGTCSESQRFRGIYLPEYSWGELTLAQLLYESA